MCIRDRVSEPTALLLGAEAITNAGVSVGTTVEAKRTLLSAAATVTLAGDNLPLDARTLVHALQGRPLTSGDVVAVDGSYADGDPTPTPLRIFGVNPPPAGMVPPATRFVTARGVTTRAVPRAQRTSTTRDVAVLTGLEEELETLTSWLALLTSPDDLPAAWGLPNVAGIILEGPTGCGKSELVGAAASTAHATVTNVNLNLSLIHIS